MARRRRKISIRVVHLRRLLPITSVRELPNVSPRTVEIIGTRMDMVTRVEINGIQVYDFAATDSTHLLVTFPGYFRGRVESAAVLSDALDQGGSSRAYYDLGTMPRATDGKYRVLQRFVKRLLTTPGTSIWNPKDGAGLRQLLVENVDTQNASAVSGEVSSKVMQAAEQLIQVQARDASTPMAERLLGATVNGVQFSAATRSLQLRATLEFQDGAFLAADVGW